MQPGPAQTRGLGAPPLLLARWVCPVAPLRPTHQAWGVIAHPSAALGAPVCPVSCATWLLFTGVPAQCVVLRVRCPGPLGSCSPVCSVVTLCCGCGVLGHLAPFHRCARWVHCVACAVSRATWLLFSGVPPGCVVFLSRLPPVHRCARSMWFDGYAVSWATCLLFTVELTQCVVLRVRCPWPLASCSPVCQLNVLCCLCGVLGHLAPVLGCAGLVRCVASAVSRATGFLFTCLLARCAVLHLQRPRLFGSCSPVCPLEVLCWMCRFLGHLAPVHPCARSVSCAGCVVSWATWLLFTSVPARCVALSVRCPGPLNRCSLVCSLGALCCVCGVLGLLAPVHRCVRSVFCAGCAVSWAAWLLFTGVPARCVVLSVRCPGPLGRCSPVCPLGVLCWLCRGLGHLAAVHRSPPLGVLCYVCGVLGHLTPVQRCARSVCCGKCAVSWATWPLFTGVLARCVMLSVRCPGPLDSCSAVCPLGVLCWLCRVLGHLAPAHRSARSVCCVKCAVSWAT